MMMYDLIMILTTIVFILQKIWWLRDRDSGTYFGFLGSLLATIYFTFSGIYMFAVMEGGYAIIMLYILLGNRSMVVQNLIKGVIVVISCVMTIWSWQGQLTLVQLISTITFLISGYVYIQPSRRYIAWILMSIAHLGAAIVTQNDTFFMLGQIVSVGISILGIRKEWKK